LIKELNNKGYDVNYTFEPLEGGNNEFYIFVIKNNNTKYCVFSNSNKSGGNAIIGNNISNKNLNDIVQNCINENQ